MKILYLDTFPYLAPEYFLSFPREIFQLIKELKMQLWK